VTAALRKIAAASAPFASRADDSGTHRVERGLWQDAGIDVVSASGSWYRETGSGMGATLNTAVGMQAYALSDRGTWLSFQNRGTLAILSEGDPRLANPYGIIRVSEARCPNVKASDAQALVDWIISAEGQTAISSYRLADQPLFFPNSGRDMEK
jgi:tungstate transport system substrate-binding protein